MSDTAQTFNFSCLTQAQRALLAQGGWAPAAGGKQPRPQVAQALVARGILVKRPVQIGMATITAYDMPEAAKAAWANYRQGRAA